MWSHNFIKDQKEWLNIKKKEKKRKKNIQYKKENQDDKKVMETGFQICAQNSRKSWYLERSKKRGSMRNEVEWCGGWGDETKRCVLRRDAEATVCVIKLNHHFAVQILVDIPPTKLETANPESEAQNYDWSTPRRYNWLMVVYLTPVLSAFRLHEVAQVSKIKYTDAVT